ncbi:MAG: hypothetical protein A2660_02505 [Candidatus Doudnabacteria bacterium RIFCSPHIGHO2_01_FULL_45_18]|uniref:Uncharacterized protein n=1 Tax=Candidatus Doudnabacteria bacterium RIFCSPHIGHO2_01_FULL_45_18 TaxID=1817823 RepID=A0A1F5NR79_9BACT|nr:MAG: hypothetical protein A2660_02505 [Candidatus Doudnabacteria bacterium RIFCSPHIGHO2_01_FULL_45_18]
MDYKNILRIHEQKIILTTGYLLVAGLAFGLGRYTLTDLPQEQSNYTPTISGLQTNSEINKETECDGKIKGSSSMIYHVPGGSFYSRTTNPIRCFDTEAQAEAADFRKSSR